MYETRLQDRMNKDRDLQAREQVIVKLMNSYGYDHDQASKVYEMVRVRQLTAAFGVGLASFATYKFRPMQRELETSYALFRKAWMRYPMLIGVFFASYHIATMLPTRLFPKLLSFYSYKGVNTDYYTSEVDLVSRFRVFDRPAAQAEASQTEDEILDYLSMHAKEPLTKPELVEHLMKKVKNKVDIASKFKIKRSGKDENDTYFGFGKVHGLENIAYVDDEKLAKAGGNPVTLQKLVYEVTGTDVPGHASAEGLNSALDQALAKYKNVVASMNLHSSDRKKLNALPFALSKRAEDPTPKMGTSEMKLFEELYGRPWSYGVDQKFDTEEKITEFNYEEYIP